MEQKSKLFLIVLFIFAGYFLQAQYCTSGGPLDNSDGNVQQVSITGDGSTSINYTASCPGYTGVEDLTSQSVDLTAGNTYSLSVTFGTCGNNNSGAGEIWIDFDDNHNFESSESVGQSSGTPGSAPWDAAVVFNFTVPTDAANGPSRMRIIQQDWGNNPLNPCDGFYTGSVMDFGINISGGQDICNMPSHQNETSITTTSATLNWTEDGSATQWEVEYGPKGFNQGNGTTVIVNTTPSYNLSGLSSGTDYSWYVHAVCSGGNKSYWEGPHSFMTNCAIQSAPYSENFDGVTTPDLPNCWSKKVVKSDPNYFDVKVETQGWGAHSNPNSVLMNSGDDPSAVLLLITPQFSDLTSQTNQIRFDAFSWSTIDLIVGTMSDPTDETTFTAFQTISLTDTYTEYTVQFDANYSGTDQYIAFKHSGADHTSLNIDDFVYEAIPSCQPPSGQTEGNITSTSAVLNWTENGSATTWNIEYGPIGFTLGGGTSITTSTKPYTLTNLSIGTTYDWYVRTDCGGGDQSTWSGPSTFTTNCAALTATYNQNFDQVTEPDLPNCWSAFIVQGASAFVSTTTNNSPHSSPNHAYLNNGSTTSGNILLVSPQFSDLTSHNNQIRFYAKADNIADLIVGTLSNHSDANTFTAFQTISLTNTYTEYSVVFGTNYTLNDQYIAFRHGLNAQNIKIFIDDFVYELASACPSPVNQTENNITLNSTDLGWTETGTASSWNIEYGDKDFTLGTGTSISGISNPHTVSDLMADHDYDWYVQADCGANGTSAWTGSSSFTTLRGIAENPSPDNEIAHVAVTATTLDWDDVPNADSYTIDIGTTYGGNDIVSNANCATSEYTYNANWSYFSTYYWRVTTVYNNGNNTAVGNVWDFTTECTPQTVPYNENFNSASAPYIPDCWNKIEISSNGSSPVIYTSNDGSTPINNIINMNNKGDLTPILLLVTPRLSDLPTQSNQIRFSAYSNYTVDLIVGTMSDPNDASTFEPYDTIFYDGSYTTWQNYTIMFGTAYTLNNEYIAFKHSGTTQWATIYFDNFYYETMPSCAVPNFLSQSNITLNSADLSWAANGSSTWNIKYGITGFDPATGGTEITGIIDNPYNLGNTLNPNTTYDWYIQADCGGGTTSNWSEVSTFTTADGKAVNPSPTSGTTNVTLSSNTLDWDDVEHAEGYYLNIGTTSGSTDVVNNAHLSQSGYVHASNWNYGKTYYWTVSTIHNGNQTVTGNEWGFEAQLGTHILPITENFDNGFDKFANKFDNNVYWELNSTLYHNGTKSVHNAYDNNNTDNILIETGTLDLTGTYAPFFTFWHIAKTEGSYDKCYVEISTDGGQTYSPLSSAAYSGNSNYSSSKQYFDEDSYQEWGTGDETPDNTWWKEETFSLSMYKTSNVRIRFRLTPDWGTKRNGWYLDDINIDQQASCSQPTAQTHNSVLGTQAELGWTENGSASEWTIEYGNQGFQLGTGTRLAVTTNPYTLTNLNGGTDYSWFVRSKCSDGNYTNWTGSDNFTTLLTPNTVSSFPYSESFESGTGLWTQQQSDDMDWTRNSGPTSSEDTGPSGASDGSFYLYTEATSHIHDNALLLIAFDFSTLTSPLLNFDYHMYGASMGTLEVQVSTNLGNSWTTVWSQNGNQGNQWMSDMANLNSYGGNSNVYLRFSGTVGDSYTSDMAIDNIVVDEAPACPRPNQLSENNITSSSADLNWTENGSATNWEIELDTAGFTPTGTPTASVSNKPYTSSNIDGAAKNEWYVRSVCSGGNHSEWTGPHTFITKPVNDECTQAIDITGTNLDTWITSSNVGATTSSAPWPHCAGTGTEDVWFTAVYPTASSYLLITTRRVNGSSFYDGGMEVYSGSCGNYTYVACDDNSSPYNQNMPQIIINDASLAGQTLFVRVWHRGDNYGKFQIMAQISPLEATWDGSENDNDWFNGSNWNAEDVPSSLTDVTIPAELSDYPTITHQDPPDNAKCKTITIESNALGDASLLGDENLQISGSATIQRYLSGGKWHEVSTMISGATVNSFYFNGTPDVWMNKYDEATDDRTPITVLGTAMPLGQGFEAWVETGYIGVTAEFTGNLNRSNVYLSTSTTPALHFTDAIHGYNLIGNPFASALKWGQGDWSLYNIENTIWVWDSQNGNYAYYSGSNGNGNLTNGIIPMGQAFFVHANASNPSMRIPKAARVHSSQDFYSPNRGKLLPHVVLDVNKENVNDEIWIVFTDKATSGHDINYDVEKMMGSKTSPQLYLTDNDRNYSIDAIPVMKAGETRVIPLDFKAGENGTQTLVAKDLDLLTDITVTLEDLKTGTLQILNDNPVYAFNAVTYQSPDRFLLHFNRAVNGINETATKKNVNVYAYEGYLYIASNGKATKTKKEVSVYDLLGRTVLEKTVPYAKLIKIPLTFSNTYVVVKVIAKNEVLTKKVFIR